jgi:hypothetical protein
VMILRGTLEQGTFPGGLVRRLEKFGGSLTGAPRRRDIDDRHSSWSRLGRVLREHPGIPARPD